MRLWIERNTRILIADGDRTFLAQEKRYLLERGHDASVASNGLEDQM